jgi:uroporphyrinogen-III decarboxylase
MMTPKPIFEKYMKPALKLVSDAMHSVGKLHCIHADADSRELLELYMESGVDMLDCYCTYPMVSVTMDETLERVGDKMVIWGGIPSTLLVTHAYSQQFFLDYIDNFFKVLDRYKGKSRVVVAVADNVVPEADIERVEIIAERCAKFKY